MGLLHRGVVLIRSAAGPVLRAPLLLLLASAAPLACGSDDGAVRETPVPAADTLAPPDTTPGDVTLVSATQGGPMPPAERAGGVPPYPGAVVWMLGPRDDPRFDAVEAFTPDDTTAVTAYYDSVLGPPEWTRTRAADAVIYERGADQAAITISPWDAAALPAEAPEVLRNARTAIGAAWLRTP